jgi:hypothetical protein
MTQFLLQFSVMGRFPVIVGCSANTAKNDTSDYTLKPRMAVLESFNYSDL